MTDRYGGYALRAGDSDVQRRYGGTSQPASAAPYVAQLRSDLVTLGFFLARPEPASAAGEFDGFLEEAVREFQVMARLPTIARERPDSTDPALYLRRLEPVVNSDRYPSADSGSADCFASGVLNTRTRRLVELWLNNRWRCPWVLAEWRAAIAEKPAKTRKKTATATPQPGPITVKGRTLVRHDLSYPLHGGHASGEVFFHDFSQHYFIDYNPLEPDPRFYVGREMYAIKSKLGRIVGPRGGSGQADTRQAHVRITPENLTGSDIGDPDSATGSTWRVVGSVASVEVTEGLEIINAYDAGTISAGLFHFTIVASTASKPHIIGKGELCGLLSWLKEKHANEFESHVADFGLRPVTPWGGDGAALFSEATRTWNDFPARESELGAMGVIVKTRQEAELLRTWQWTARFKMLAQVSPGYREGNWYFSRLRLKKIREVPIGGGWPASWSIGNVFSAESTMAKVLRAHVNAPANIAVKPPREAVRAARRIGKLLDLTLTAAEKKQDPVKWADEVHARIDDALGVAYPQFAIDRITVKNGKKTQSPGDFPRMDAWKYDGRPLSLAAKSFLLDEPT